MPDTFTPYADDTSAQTIDGMTIENGTDRVSISGCLDLRKDRRGLDHAKALRAALDAIVMALEADRALPAKAAPAPRAKTTKAPNPFA